MVVRGGGGGGGGGEEEEEEEEEEEKEPKKVTYLFLKPFSRCPNVFPDVYYF